MNKALPSWICTIGLAVAMLGNAMATESSAARMHHYRKAASVHAKSVHKSVHKLVARVVPQRPSVGQQQGLHGDIDALALKSSVALVIDQDTHEVLFSKNPQAVLPIASITKLMTALVINEAQLPLDEVLSISQDDVDLEKGSRSRLTVGTQL